MSSPPANRKRSPHAAGSGGGRSRARTAAANPGAAKPKGAARKEREAARRELAASARGRASRRRRLLTVLAPVGAVVVVLALLVVINAASSRNRSGKKSTDAAAAVVAQVTGVPTAAFDAAGAAAGTQNKALTATGDGLLTAAGGKPRVLYIGAEYCPFCAAERWPVIVALARFGTWEGLKYSYSGPAPEVFPDTPTFTFHGAAYTSRWIAFTGVETQTNQQVNGSWGPLDKLSAADEAIMRKYDSEGSIPFTDLAGRYVINGATYDPGVLRGKTHAQIAATLNKPDTSSGKTLLGAANLITATICEATGGQPANVCTSAGVAAAARALPK